MKHRDYKQFGPGRYCHIYNRGNAKADLYIEESDFSFFSYRLKENLFGRPMPDVGSGRYTRQLLAENSFTLVAYCLMPNHFHWLIRQDADIPLNVLVHKVCTSYSKYFNKKYDRIGHVFQDQFKAVDVVTDEQLMWLSAYIHTNPVMAGLAAKPEHYTWSSYQDYLGLRAGTLCNTELVLSHFKSHIQYQTFVNNSIPLIKQRKDIKNLLLDE